MKLNTIFNYLSNNIKINNNKENNNNNVNINNIELEKDEENDKIFEIIEKSYNQNENIYSNILNTEDLNNNTNMTNNNNDNILLNKEDVNNEKKNIEYCLNLIYKQNDLIKKQQSIISNIEYRLKNLEEENINLNNKIESLTQQINNSKDKDSKLEISKIEKTKFSDSFSMITNKENLDLLNNFSITTAKQIYVISLEKSLNNTNVLNFDRKVFCIVILTNKCYCIGVNIGMIFYHSNFKNIIYINQEKNKIQDIIEIKDSKLVVSFQETNLIKIYSYNLNSCECIQKLAEHMYKVTKLLLLNENTFISSSMDKTIIIWKIEPNKIIKQEQLVGHKSGVTSIAKINEDNIISTVKEEDKIYFWDLKTKNYEIFNEKIKLSSSNNNIIVLDNNYILIGGTTYFYFIDIKTKKVLQKIKNSLKSEILSFLKLNSNEFLVGDNLGIVYQYCIKKNKIEFIENKPLTPEYLMYSIDAIIKPDNRIIFYSRSSCVVFLYDYYKKNI